MTENHDSHWEKISGKLHGELSLVEEAAFMDKMSGDSPDTDYEKAEKIKADLFMTVSLSEEAKKASWSRIEQNIKFSHLRWIKVVMQYAAIAILAFVAGNLLNTKSTVDKPLKYSEIHVPYGQMSQLTLSDGTEVWLNSGTTLRYPESFGEKSRSVELKGEAFFKVAKMTKKPFTVNSTDLKIEVLGTSFNFSAYQEDGFSSVTLVEGKVSVMDNLGQDVAQLKPGQMATKNRNTNSLKINEVETASYSAWTEGKIYFDNERLDQIALKLERWFNVEITFADLEPKSKQFTGTILKNKPVDQIMQALELLAPIQFQHQINVDGKDKITIYQRINKRCL